MQDTLIPYRRARAWPSAQPLGRVRARANLSCIQEAELRTNNVLIKRKMGIY